jgi:hemerythrin superfamily protein
LTHGAVVRTVSPYREAQGENVDAIQVIRADHRAIQQLFTRYDRVAKEGDEDEQRRLVRAIVRELSIHAAVEEQLLYPALRDAGVEERVLGALEEHHLVKLTLAELDAMAPSDERFGAKVTLLMENVGAHVREEEQELLPRLRRALDARELRELGESLAGAKRIAPTRPHPTAPDQPPAGTVAAAVAAILDRIRDAFRGGLELVWLAIGAGTARGRAAATEAVRDAGRQGRGAIADVRDWGRETAGEAWQRGRELGAAVEGRGEAGARQLRERTQSAARTTRSAARTAKARASAAARAARGKSKKGTRRPAAKQRPHEGAPPVVH